MGITVKQFAQLEERLGGKRSLAERVSSAANCSTPPARSLGGTTILGVDSSLRGTGWGILRVEFPKSRYLGCGTIACARDWPRSRCLLHIFETLRQILRQHSVTVCVIEGLFYAQNQRTTLILGEARGAALAAVAEAHLEIFEIAPRKVKQAIAGYGGAHKRIVARMVQRRLGLSEVPTPDAADALALALTYAQWHSRYGFERLTQI
jgi:crossover junction endodeoxyribonuclease RuvC